MSTADLLRLAGSALGALGGTLVFVEFFQTPSYVEYDREFGDYGIDVAPRTVREHTWIGRGGGLCIAVGFALLFVAALV